VPLPFQTALPASELDGLPIGAIPAAGDAATRYRWLDRRREIGALAVLSLAVAGCLSVSLGPPPKLGNVKGPLDVELYYAVTQRVQAGQAYYDALGGELQARGYSTRSVFNWRTPLHMELIAHLPSLAWARVLRLLAAACAVGLSTAAMCRDRRNDDGRGWSGAGALFPRIGGTLPDATADGGMRDRTRMAWRTGYGAMDPVRRVALSPHYQQSRPSAGLSFLGGRAISAPRRPRVGGLARPGWGSV
jgi:hypothetical protein